MRSSLLLSVLIPTYLVTILLYYIVSLVSRLRLCCCIPPVVFILSWRRCLIAPRFLKMKPLFLSPSSTVGGFGRIVQSAISLLTIINFGIMQNFVFSSICELVEALYLFALKKWIVQCLIFLVGAELLCRCSVPSSYFIETTFGAVVQCSLGWPYILLSSQNDDVLFFFYVFPRVFRLLNPSSKKSCFRLFFSSRKRPKSPLTENFLVAFFRINFYYSISVYLLLFRSSWKWYIRLFMIVASFNANRSFDR